MVKQTKPRVYKVKPGPKVDLAAVRSERVTMRMHPDLVAILDARATERGVSRSAYVEQVIVGWVQADPRNPKVDARGMYVEGAPSPWAYRLKQPVSFGNKFAQFSQAYAVIMGTPAPQKWVEEEDAYLPESYEPPADEPLSDQAKAWIEKRRGK